jgi:hypothetical protein
MWVRKGVSQEKLNRMLVRKGVTLATIYTTADQWQNPKDYIRI